MKGQNPSRCEEGCTVAGETNASICDRQVWKAGWWVEFTVRKGRKASALGLSTLEWCLLRRFLGIPNQCFERGLPSLNALNDNLGG
jgi:hypothetical protein